MPSPRPRQSGKRDRDASFVVAAIKGKRTTAPRQPKPMSAKAKRLYEIKPLVWLDYDGIHSAETPLGILKIKRYWGLFEAWLGYSSMLSHKRYSSINEAKKAIERWYQQQLRRALREVSQ